MLALWYRCMSEYSHILNIIMIDAASQTTWGQGPWSTFPFSYLKSSFWDSNTNVTLLPRRPTSYVCCHDHLFSGLSVLGLIDWHSPLASCLSRSFSFWWFTVSTAILYLGKSIGSNGAQLSRQSSVTILIMPRGKTFWTIHNSWHYY